MAIRTFLLPVTDVSSFSPMSRWDGVFSETQKDFDSTRVANICVYVNVSTATDPNQPGAEDSGLILPPHLPCPQDAPSSVNTQKTTFTTNLRPQMSPKTGWPFPALFNHHFLSSFEHLNVSTQAARHLLKSITTCQTCLRATVCQGTRLMSIKPVLCEVLGPKSEIWLRAAPRIAGDTKAAAFCASPSLSSQRDAGSSVTQTALPRGGAKIRIVPPSRGVEMRNTTYL